MLNTPLSLAMYRANLYLLSAWPCYWNAIAQHLIKQMVGDMDGHLLILNFDCEDVTGKFETVVVLERRNGMYVAHYADFDTVTTISRTRRDLDYWLPAMLRTMLAEESGIMPKVRFRNVEVWKKESPDVRASGDS